MKDNVVAFPEKRFDPIHSVHFLLSHELPLLEAISTVMAQVIRVAEAARRPGPPPRLRRSSRLLRR